MSKKFKVQRNFRSGEIQTNLVKGDSIEIKGDVVIINKKREVKSFVKGCPSLLATVKVGWMKEIKKGKIEVVEKKEEVVEKKEEVVEKKEEVVEKKEEVVDTYSDEQVEIHKIVEETNKKELEKLTKKEKKVNKLKTKKDKTKKDKTKADKPRVTRKKPGRPKKIKK